MPNAPAPAPAVDLAPFGLLVGHAADAEGATGCTVLLARDRALRAVARLAATGMRRPGDLAARPRPHRSPA